MAIEYTDQDGFSDNDNSGGNTAVFSQGTILSGTGTWANSTWSYDQPMYGFGFDVDMDASQAQLLGVSNGVASVYIPRGWLADPMEFFGFTSTQPFTSVALTFGTGVMQPPEGLPPYPSTDYYYEMRDQMVAYDPPAPVPEGSNASLCAFGLGALLLFRRRFFHGRRQAAATLRDAGRVSYHIAQLHLSPEGGRRRKVPF